MCVGGVPACLPAKFRLFSPRSRSLERRRKMKTGGSERKTAWGGGGLRRSVPLTLLIFDFKGQSRSGVISCMETTGALTVICRAKALNNP